MAPDPAPFADDAVADPVLADQRAAYHFTVMLKARDAQSILDDQARSAERLTAGLGRISMDVVGHSRVRTHRYKCARGGAGAVGITHRFDIADDPSTLSRCLSSRRQSS